MARQNELQEYVPTTLMESTAHFNGKAENYKQIRAFKDYKTMAMFTVQTSMK